MQETTGPTAFKDSLQIVGTDILWNHVEGYKDENVHSIYALRTKEAQAIAIATNAAGRNLLQILLTDDTHRAHDGEDIVVIWKENMRRELEKVTGPQTDVFSGNYYVVREYEESKLGNFDGTLKKISLYIQKRPTANVYIPDSDYLCLSYTKTERSDEPWRAKPLSWASPFSRGESEFHIAFAFEPEGLEFKILK